MGCVRLDLDPEIKLSSVPRLAVDNPADTATTIRPLVCIRDGVRRQIGCDECEIEKSVAREVASVPISGPLVLTGRPQFTGCIDPVSRSKR